VTGTRRLGVLLALLSAASFGIMPVLTKVVYDDGADTFGVLSVRFSLASAALLALALVRREDFARGKVLLALVLLGGVGYTVESLCYFAALERISAGLTSLLLYLYPALVVVLSAVFLRHRPGRLSVACVAVSLAGTALTIGPVGGGQGTGVLLGVCAAVAYATYIVISSRVTRGLAPFATSAVVTGACGAVYDALALTRGAHLPTHAGSWLALLGVALFGTVIAIAAFFAALALLGPGDTAVVSTLEPVVSVVAAAVFLGETLTSVQLAGGVLVIGAVVALARQPQ
jgi:drug/metabolite transporter (DMT)-like permease